MKYTITTVFKQLPISMSAVAKKANINANSLRLYACGVKVPSFETLEKVERAIKEIGKELLEATLDY